MGNRVSCLITLLQKKGNCK